MAKRLLWYCALCILVQIALLSAPLWAKSLLNPSNDPDMPVVCRSVDADVDIQGQFATTRLTLVFQHFSQFSTEVEFAYDVPEGALATGFAYWAGDEKVVGRIVEKKQAANIYRDLTRVSRDPALVEMVAKNRFRARIAPVMAYTDLQVELVVVQSLRSNQGGFGYTLPLADLCGADDDLERVNVVVHGAPGPGISQVTNNYGLPVTKQGETYRVRLSGINYRPPKDFTVRFRRTPARLHVSSYAYPTSRGGDGFFALLLTPDHTLTKPRVSVGGVGAYDVRVQGTGVRANGSLLVCGRYKKPGKAQVSLSGKGASGALVYTGYAAFSASPKASNLASKLWAAGKIELLSVSPRKRAEVVRLSLQYTLPSRYTSWLAVPKAERERLNREKYRAQMDPLEKKLTQMMADGTDNTPQAKKLWAQYNAWCAKAGLRPDEESSWFWYSAISILSNKMAPLYFQGKKDTIEYRRMAERYAKIAKLSRDNISEDPLARMRSYSYGYFRELARLKADGEGGSAEAKRLESSLEDLYGLSFSREFGQAADSIIDESKRSYITAVYGVKPDPKTASKAMGRLKCLDPSFDPDKDPDFVRSRSDAAGYSLNEIANRIVDYATAAKKPDRELQALRERYDELKTTAPSPYWSIDNTIKDAAKNAMTSKAWSLVQLENESKPNGKQIKVLEAEMVRLERAYGVSAKDAVAVQEADRANDACYYVVYAVRNDEEQSSETKIYRKYLEQWCKKTGTDINAMIVKTAKSELESAARNYAYAKTAARPSQEWITQAEAELRRVERLAGESAESKVREYMGESPNYIKLQELERLYDGLDEELIKNKPNKQRVVELGNQAKPLASGFGDGWVEERYTKLFELGTAIVDKRLEVRSALEQGDVKKASAAKNDQAILCQEIGALHWQMFRPGDPLISVNAPADAVQVVGVMPDGEVKVLEYNPDKKFWEARFDIPPYASEGDYPVSVVIVFKDGTRSVSTLNFGLDVTAPEGTGAINATAGNALLRLDASEDTVRVVAVLPWGDRVELADPAETRRYSAMVVVPAEYQGEAYPVTFVLTDSAHNRTSITVDSTK